MFRQWISSLRRLLLLLLAVNLPRYAYGYTVRGCSAIVDDEPTCCQCPQPAQHWTSNHCDALATDANIAWPTPYDSSCEVTIVSTCDIEGTNTPVIFDSGALDPQSMTHANDTYNLLGREYAVTLLNIATGFDSCTDHTTLTESLLSATIPGLHEDIALKADVIDRTLVLLTLHCVDKSFESVTTQSEVDEISWLTALLKGYNTGVLFTGDTYCALGGDLETAYGSDWHGADTFCSTMGFTTVSDNTCTLDPDSWLDLSCTTGTGAGDTTQCPRWPGSTVTEPTNREDTFVCGDQETYVDILMGASDSETTDKWFELGTQYVSAKLNSEGGVCRTGTVIDAIADALVELHADCPCSAPELLGQVGCVHDNITSPRDTDVYDPLIAILSDFNTGITGPGGCRPTSTSGNRDARDAETALDVVTDSRFCCSGGCTRGYAYFLTHSCHTWHSGEKYREAWPGGNDLVCSTLPNVEDDTTLCDKTYHFILSKYNTQHGREHQDAWNLLAQSYIVTRLNENSGACTRDALTQYSTADDPWNRLTIDQVMVEAKKLLLSACSNAGSVSFGSTLGVEMHALRTVLDDFINGNYGPGKCFPNGGHGACTDISLRIDLVPTDVTVNIRANNGRVTNQCTLDEDAACCTKTAHYWSRYNKDEEAPRNVLGDDWPLIITSATCDYDADICYQNADIGEDGSLQVDTFARDLAQVLHVNPVRFAPKTPFGGVQEHASYCSSNVTGTYINSQRPVATQMAALLKLARSTSRSQMSTDYSVRQRKWIRLANALTTAMLNVRYMVNHFCADPTDLILRQITSLDVYKYLADTDYLQQCVFGACDLNPEQNMPSLQDSDLCSTGFFSVVNALETFSNGMIVYPHISTSNYRHCGIEDPPEACDTNDMGGYCECVKNRVYYENHYQGHELPSFRVTWPRVTIANDAIISFPNAYIPAAQRPTPAHSEDFAALVCPTAFGVKDITWFDIMIEPQMSSNDAYLDLMKQVLPAWLNIFAGACPPADVRDALMEATDLVGSLVESGATGLCVSSVLGTRMAIDKTSANGVLMVSETRVLRSFNEGYQGSEACIDHCTEDGAPSCGKNGLCNPETGNCVCDPGFTGNECDFLKCSGHGIFSDGVCACTMGWGGDICDVCGSPQTASAHLFVCLPCSVEVCGVSGKFLLDHAPAVNVTAFVAGTQVLPGYADLAVPLRPGSGGLDCACQDPNAQEDVFNRRSGYPKYGKYGKYVRNVRTDRISAEFYAAKRSRLKAKEDSDSQKSKTIRRLNSGKHASRAPYSHIGLSGRQALLTRDLCDDDDEETIIEEFLLFCLEQQTLMQTYMEESCAMYMYSIEACEEVCDENNIVTHVDLLEQQDDDNDENRILSISTLAIAAVILFVLVFALIILLLVWAGVRVTRPTNPSGQARPQGRAVTQTHFDVTANKIPNSSGTTQGVPPGVVPANRAAVSFRGRQGRRGGHV